MAICIPPASGGNRIIVEPTRNVFDHPIQARNQILTSDRTTWPYFPVMRFDAGKIKQLQKKHGGLGQLFLAPIKDTDISYFLVRHRTMDILLVREHEKRCTS